MLEQTTSEQSLIEGLIATYRVLNMQVRPMPEDRLALASGRDGSVRDTVRRLRDSELRFSQALKERITGVPMPEFLQDEAPVVGTEHGEEDSTNVLLSQFGTARESTLAMLRGLAADEWTQTIEGGKTITHRIEQLLQNDRVHLEKITGMLGAPDPGSSGPGRDPRVVTTGT
ncbi:MAG: hypothetical protein M3462_12705 [Chloroflexota bacterium]|nr:hypothetical protein [Chloroflexota bacterium]